MVQPIHINKSDHILAAEYQSLELSITKHTENNPVWRTSSWMKLRQEVVGVTHFNKTYWFALFCLLYWFRCDIWYSKGGMDYAANCWKQILSRQIPGWSNEYEEEVEEEEENRIICFSFLGKRIMLTMWLSCKKEMRE